MNDDVAKRLGQGVRLRVREGHEGVAESPKGGHAENARVSRATVGIRMGSSPMGMAAASRQLRKVGRRCKHSARERTVLVVLPIAAALALSLMGRAADAGAASTPTTTVRDDHSGRDRLPVQARSSTNPAFLREGA